MSGGAIDASLLSRLREAVDRRFEEEVAFLQSLVRFDSLRGKEAPCQAWLAHQFEARGWSVDRFTIAEAAISGHPRYCPSSPHDAEAMQLMATVPYVDGGPAARSAILQGHVDVVPPGPAEMWEKPPFSGVVENGWLFGRGAQDMKMGIAAMIFALDALRQAGLTPGAPIYVNTVTEEESTGNGALASLARGYRADACVIPEPTSNTITRAQTGAVWFRLAVAGRPVHVGRSETGTNAILSVYRLIEALQALTRELNEEARATRWFGEVSDPIKFNPGIIRGGDWPSSTPAWCTLDCRLGLLPEHNAASLCDRVEACIARAAADDPFLAVNAPRIAWSGFLAEGSSLEPGSEAEATLARAHEAVLGAAMTARLSTAVNDTRYYNLDYGIPGLCYGPAGKGMHGFDERANLSSLKETTVIFAAFIADWCAAKG